jgi:diguanylate cyclase (GGDEF)-like protein
LTTLEYTIHGIRRGWRVTRTFLFAGAFAAAVVCGVFTGLDTGAGQRVAALVLFGLWAAVFGVGAHRRFTAERGAAETAGRVDLELGLLLVVGTHAVVQLTGGLGSAIYPLVFVLVAFLVVYTRQWVGSTLLTATIALEFGIVAAGRAGGRLGDAVAHAVFVLAFALINLVFTRGEVLRMRRRTDEQIEQAKVAMADDARDFRLTAPASGLAPAACREEEEARLSRAGVGEVRRAMYHHVDLLKRTMGLHTCVLLWLDACGESLRVLECASDDGEAITQRRMEPREGAVGAVLQRRGTLTLKDLKPGAVGLPYYDRPAPVTDFLGVPVIEHGSLRGALCADRADGRPFGEVEEQNLQAAADGLLQIVVNERVLTQLQRAKSEQTKLLAASSALSRSLTDSEVVDAALDAAAVIANFDLAAVALVEPDGKLAVRKARGEGADQLDGKRLAGATSLAACALKTRHFLPYRGEFDPRQQVLLGKQVQKVFARMRSALVLPLLAGDESLGVLALATASPAAYNEAIRTTMQVMTNQLGSALKNAQMVRRLEELATTDGLTGLANHRMFQEELDRQLAVANRFGQGLSLILCDVDKFKNVNDTYGHPVGDLVLKGLAEVLRRNVVRDTDLPARYGGEEFTVVCGGTDTDGAFKLAERIRKELQQQVFHTDKGELRVTISMGVSSFPEHARDKQLLVQRADAALYAAKQGGRNQVRIWSGEGAQA